MAFPFFRKGQGGKKSRSGARFDRGEWQLFYHDRPAPRGAKFPTIKKKTGCWPIATRVENSRVPRSREGALLPPDRRILPGRKYLENCRNTGASGALLIPEPITNIYPRYRKIKFILKRTIKNKEKDRCETEKYVIPFLHPLLSDNSNNIVTMIFHPKGTHYRFDQISRRIPSSNHVSRNTRHYARSPLVFQYTPEYAKRACTLASVKLHGASNPQGAHEPVQCGEGSPRKPLLWNFERVAVPAQLA